jgi:glutaconate CoA-transferase subunit B
LVVVTDLGLMEPDASGELTLTALHPGCSVEQVKENTGWPIKIAATLNTTQPVLKSELNLLRNELDPEGIYLKG